MEIKQNPFSLYDFLGYFVPGALFLYAISICISFAAPTDPFVQLVSQQFKLEPPSFYLLFVLGAYVTGHLLSFLSSITVEKYSVWRVGYPSKYLLGLPYPKYFEVDAPELARIAVRLIIAIFLLPIMILDITGQIFKLNELYAKPLDPTLVDILRSKVGELVHKRAKEAVNDESAKQVDFFRLVYHYTVENAPAHLPKMQNYVALYGFCRTITLIAILLFWINFITMFLGKVEIWTALFGLSALGVLSFLCFLDFMKFYRRFSLEVLMALSAIYPKEK